MSSETFHTHRRQRQRLRGLPFAWLALALGVSVLATSCGAPEERETALRAIARWEDRRLAPSDSLARLIEGADAHVRHAAVRAAGLIGRDDVLPELVQALGDPSTTVQEAAAFALGLLGNRQAIPSLREAANGPHRRVRLAALDGLAHLSHDGEVFFEPALHGDRQEAVRAWNGLRNRAEDVPPGRLVATIQSGLARNDPDVLWRVLRCAERVTDSTLVPQLAPFAVAADAQRRVHACRALARREGQAALEAVLASCEDPGRFSAREEARIRVAQLRALGRLLPAALAVEQITADDAYTARITAPLLRGARHENPHVASTALHAMAAAVAELPAPFAAAKRESLLPVWRIRLIRIAEELLASPSASVRAGAVEAYGELRGMSAEYHLVDILRDPHPHVQAAVLTALSRQAHNPWYTLNGFAEGRLQQQAGSAAPSADSPVFSAPGLLRAAALSASADRYENRREIFPFDVSQTARIRDRYVIAPLLAAVTDSNFVIAATAAPLLGHFRTAETLVALDEAYRRASGEGAADIRLGVLDGLAAFFTSVADSDSTAGVEPLKLRARGILEAAFDAPDLRLRLRAREVAAEGRLLPAELIPSAASLRATLPPHARSPRQPPVALPFAAPHVRCITARGEFVIALDGEIAPNTVSSFLALIRSGFYDNLCFHRVVPDFVIQGGDPRGDGWGGPGYTIRSEWSRRKYERGTVGIAHSGKDTGGSQFFVCLSPQPHLNGRYTVFGKVVKGMEVVDRIQPGDRFRLVIEE